MSQPTHPLTKSSHASSSRLMEGTLHHSVIQRGLDKEGRGWGGEGGEGGGRGGWGLGAREEGCHAHESCVWCVMRWGDAPLVKCDELVCDELVSGRVNCDENLQRWDELVCDKLGGRLNVLKAWVMTIQHRDLKNQRAKNLAKYGDLRWWAYTMHGWVSGLSGVMTLATQHEVGARLAELRGWYG